VTIFEGWRFCPRCAHELEPRERGHLVCPSCGASYWANSAPAVQGVLERDGRILLGRRAIEPRIGHWDLPGGFLEEGEEALDGLRREFKEETGLDVEPADWLGAFMDPYDNYFVLGLTWIVHAEGEPRAAGLGLIQQPDVPVAAGGQVHGDALAIGRDLRCPDNTGQLAGRSDWPPGPIDPVTLNDGI